jgi:hypothetical protein
LPPPQLTIGSTLIGREVEAGASHPSRPANFRLLIDIPDGSLSVMRILRSLFGTYMGLGGDSHAGDNA